MNSEKAKTARPKSKQTKNAISDEKRKASQRSIEFKCDDYIDDHIDDFT